jgi:hypothetical protein
VRPLALLAILIGCTPFSPLADGGEVSLFCERGDDKSILSCILTNSLKKDVLWLGSPFVLEGPLGGDDYIFIFTGGERIENTLEYGLATLSKLGGPIQLHPTIHLSETDVSRLFRIQAGADVAFDIRLRSAEPGSNLIEPEEWLFRAKVVVGKVHDLVGMIENDQISPECADQLYLGFTFRPAPAKIPAIEPGGSDRGYEIDGCRDRISEQFDHVYSNELLAAWSLRKPPGSKYWFELDKEDLN